MTGLEEKNPLEFETETSIEDRSHFKNNVGRPKKNDEILFSAQPKSIMSLLLSKEKDRGIIKQQGENKDLKETTVKPIKKWTCEYCPERKFHQKNQYKQHLTVHKLYKCDHSNCSYSTKFTSNLKIHKRIHTSEFLYVCDECTFRTKFINSLNTHKRLHKGDKPFACQHCEYRCNSVSNLKIHCARKHS